MSKKSISFILFLSGFLLASCQKSVSDTGDKSAKDASDVLLAPATFQVNLSESSKIHIYDNVRVGWDLTDKLSVFGQNGVNSRMDAVSVNGSSAVFSGTVEVSGPYVAVCPYDINATCTTGAVTAVIPSVQKLGSLNVASGALITVASAASLSSAFNFKNVTSLLKVSIESEGYTSVKISSNDGSALAGKVTVNPATAEITEVVEPVTDVTLLPADESFEKGDYYIAVLPCSVKGVTLTLTRLTDKRKSEKTSENTLSVARNQIMNLGSYGADKLEWQYLIYDYQDLKDYAADVINWDEFGETIQLKGDIDMKMEAWVPLTDLYDGEFQGNGHKIYNINIKSSKYQHLGFFGKYFKDVRNVVFGSKDGETYDGNSVIENSYNASADSWTYTAPITFSNGIIENVENFIPVTVKKSCTHKSRTSGISAWTERDGVEIINCVNHADITLEASPGADRNVNVSGILSGINSNNVVVRNCKNYGKISSSSKYTKGIAGIVGLNYTASITPIVENCENYGDIYLLYSDTQNDFICVGGIMGRSNSKDGNQPFRIQNCTNYGNVYAKGVHQQGAGGIVGRADGSYIDGCKNYGNVTIDHTQNATARCQSLGGILGHAAAGYGCNSVTNCENHGNLIMKAFSCGRASTSASSVFYGVTAGGIVGCAESLDALVSNRNYGSIDAQNGYSAKNTETLRSTMFVGGILGYDMGTIGVFGPNITGKNVTISAKNTASSASKAVARAGGIVGYLENSTMIAGAASADIIASNANASATVQAGSVVGYNTGVIQYAGYAGTVNGAAANVNNVVGAGTKAIASGPAGDEDTDNTEGGLIDPTGEEGKWD